MLIVYYSGPSENTHRFVQKLDVKNVRIPIRSDNEIEVSEPFILVTPSYLTTQRTLPPQVVKFLNNKNNRDNLVGVIGTGNTNFNKDYAIGAKVVSEKCQVPLFYVLELLGTSDDVENVKKIITEQEETEKVKR